jgi:hypothetical protein
MGVRKVREEILGSAMYPSFFTTMSIAELRTKLADLDSKYADQGYRDITLEEESGYMDGGPFFALYGTRDETDKEREKRLAKAKRDREYRKLVKQKKQEKERKTYERLKKKFED